MEGGVHIKLIGEGTYGCVYHPGVNCLGTKENPNFLTKIQKNQRSIKNEIDVAERIRKIKGYTRFFAPILKHCPVKLTKDTAEGLKQCEVFANDSLSDTSSYVSTKIRYVGKRDLGDYMENALKHDDFFKEVIKSHIYLLKGVQKLTEHKIVHADIKPNNIMYDEKLEAPIFIDFGLSFFEDGLLSKTEDLSNIFIAFDFYTWWPIEVVVCNYVIRQIGQSNSANTVVSQEQLDEICGVFLKGLESETIQNDMFKMHIMEREELQLKFRSEFKTYFYNFVGHTWWSVYKEMVKYANTWDNYSVATTYLIIMDDSFLQNNLEYAQQREKFGENYGKYLEILKKVVYCSPDKRLSVKDTIKLLSKL
jgi:serine/threonine protein kinase